MPVFDLKSDIKVVQSDYVVVAANGTTDGAIIDTANFELGLVFALAIFARTDGAYELIIRESDDPTFASSNIVPAEKLIGQFAANSTVLADGDQMPTVGVFSTKRYVRAVLQASAVTLGATVGVIAIQEAELMPVANP